MMTSSVSRSNSLRSERIDLAPQATGRQFKLIAWMAALAIMALSAHIVWKEWRESHLMAEVSVLNTARILAHQVETSLDQADALLLSFEQRYRGTRQDPEAQEALAEQIRRELPYYPLVARVGVINARGQIVFNTGFQGRQHQPLDLSERDYFRRAQAGETGVIYGVPIEAKLTGEWVLPVVRRMEDRSRLFQGVVFAVIPVKTMGRTFSQIDLGKTGIVNLRMLDFTQVMRHPPLEGDNKGIGNRNVSKTIRDLMRERPGQDHYVYKTVAPIDGTERVYAYAKFDHSPFWMTVGRATADFTTSWRQTAVLLALLSISLTGLLLWGARRLDLQNRSLQQRVAEKALAQLALQSSESRFRGLVEQSLAGIYISQDGLFKYLNPRLAEMLGYGDASELVNRIRVADHLFPERPPPETPVAIEGGENKDKGCELVILTKDGTELVVDAYEVEALIDGVPARLGMVIDISDRKQMAEELDRYRQHLEQLVQERTAELQAANQELDAFAYAVSHDLRAPLRAMSGFATALEEDYGAQLQGEAHDFLAEIVNAGGRMGALIDGILKLSRSTRGGLQRENTDLSGLANEILDELRRAEPQRKVRIEVEPGLRANGDHVMLRSVLQNLLGNAWKYTSGREEALIRFHSQQAGENRRYCVSDNGAGFDMAHSERLFKPFQRLHRQDEFPGLGIGLATVKRIISRHGGDMTAEGRPGEGATFCFTLGGRPGGSEPE